MARARTTTATTAPTAAAPRQLMAREERQAQLLRAAATAFARTGFAATSMDDVAAEAGVTKLIVYRHFSSKEDLYREVLTAVADRLRDEFVGGLQLPEGNRHGFMTRSILTVARENPDGFRLLMVHAAREAQFVDTELEIKQRGLDLAAMLIGDMIPDPVIKAWASRVIIDHLVYTVLAWLDVGDATRDEEFIELATQGLIAMFLAYFDEDRLPDKLRNALARVRAEQPSA